MEHLSQTFHDLVVHLGYPGLFIVMFLGNIGTPVGTEVVMPTAGALAAQGHFPSLSSLPGWIVVAIVGTIGEICGATALYEVGYHGGLPFVHRYGRYVGFKERELGHVQRFFAKFGHWAVFLARFVPFVRGVASLPAGLSRMPLRYFSRPRDRLGDLLLRPGVSRQGRGQPSRRHHRRRCTRPRC